MFAIIFSVFYLILNFFISVDMYLWIKSFKNPFRWKRAIAIFVSVYIVLTSLIFIAFILPDSMAKIFFSRISNYYQGFLINLSMVLAVAHIVTLFLKLFKVIPRTIFYKGKSKLISGSICAVVSISFSLYGFINANNITVSTYDVAVDKKGEDMKIVLVSDIHLGYSIGIRTIKDMVGKINNLDADLVCFTGDIFDNDYDAIDAPEKIKNEFRSIKSRYGVYACWGNHDVKDSLFGGFTISSDGLKKQDERMKSFLEDSEISVLEDESVVIDNKFTIIGRLDREKPGTDDKTRLDISEFDKTGLVIDMDHEPAELQETTDAGIDIDLSGHTHNGQFFPLTLVIDMMWENPAGYIKKVSSDGKHTMHSIVTEGVGVYGPFMRTFTKSEICEINVHFTK